MAISSMQVVSRPDQGGRRAPIEFREGVTNSVDSVKTGCKTELETYCKPVTPGEGRLLACLYAYEDKLSGQCQYALYDASIRLERAVAAINYVAHECRADIESHCASVKAGEGRIATCLKEHSREIRPNCSQALTDVGID